MLSCLKYTKRAFFCNSDDLTLLCPPADPNVVGFAMYYFTYDPWVGKQLYLEEFYVMDTYRGGLNASAHHFTAFLRLYKSQASIFSSPLSVFRAGHRFGDSATPQ